MKTIKLFVLILFAMGISLGASAQMNMQKSSLKTETIKVAGKCETCKTRIEKAAKTDGVTKANWNIKTQVLTVTYYPSMVTNAKIQKNIAAVGHDTEKVKASNKVYASLPGCCKYKRLK